MTWQKLFNIPLFLPILAFFVPAPASILFAIFPNYWAFNGFQALIEGANFGTYLLTGIVYSIILLVLIVRRFTQTHFQ
jgi:hypothetical protein